MLLIAFNKIENNIIKFGLYQNYLQSASIIWLLKRITHGKAAIMICKSNETSAGH